MSSAPPGGRAPTRPTIGTVLGVGARFPRRSCPHSIECGNAGQLITPKPNEPCFPMSSTEPGRTANTPGHAGRSVRGRTRSGIAARQGSRPRKPGSLGRTTRSSVFRRSGHTAEENRPTQEKFRCGSCGHSARADSVGALNALWIGPGRPDQAWRGAPGCRRGRSSGSERWGRRPSTCTTSSRTRWRSRPGAEPRSPRAGRTCRSQNPAGWVVPHSARSGCW